jgi:3-oxoacyl-[acyl-carrier protein] reductase
MVRHFQWFRCIIPVSSQQVAQALVAGLTRGSNEILVGWQSHLAVWCNRIAPWLMEKILLCAAPLPTNQQKPYPELRQAGAISR